MMVSFIFGDLVAVSDDKASLIALKWTVLAVLLMVMSYNLIQIVKVIRIPFHKEKSEKTVDVRKEKIVSKKHLVSQSELILNKYRGNK